MAMFNGIQCLFYTLLVFFACFVVVYCLSIYFAKKQNHGAEWTVRQFMKLIRLLIIIEIFLLVSMILFRAILGVPFQVHVITDYGNGDSWIYGYGHPIIGIATMIPGLLCDMHVTFLLISLAGCAVEIVFDSISAVQVSDYQIQVIRYGAPGGRYTSFTYNLYIWCDCFSSGVCLFLCLAYLYILSLTCWFRERRSLNFRSIEGGPWNRSAVMRKHFVLRKNIHSSIKP